MMQSDFIKEYWEKQASTFGGSHKASWGDNFMIDLEIDLVSKHISDNDAVLDAGCGNGYSTIQQNEMHPLKSITGIDYAENMIAEARKTLEYIKAGGNISFETGDIRTLRFKDDSFDVVYTTRVLINLPNWQQQIQGINECLRVVRPGGKVILCEAFWEPLVLLNSMRQLKQLPPLVEHDFNRYIKKQRLDEYLKENKLSYTVDDYSSIYYLGSRFLRELVTDPSQYPEYTNPVNEIFYNIEKQFSGGGFGIQQAYIIVK